MKRGRIEVGVWVRVSLRKGFSKMMEEVRELVGCKKVFIFYKKLVEWVVKKLVGDEGIMGGRSMGFIFVEIGFLCEGKISVVIKLVGEEFCLKIIEVIFESFLGGNILFIGEIDISVVKFRDGVKVFFFLYCSEEFVNVVFVVVMSVFVVEDLIILNSIFDVVV